MQNFNINHLRIHELLLTSALLALFVTGCRPGSGRSDEDLRVATYNIRLSCGEPGSDDCWVERRESLVKTIRRMEPDVFGLQEVCPDQLAYLKESLGGFVFAGDHRERDRKSGEASPVAYRTDRFDVEKSGTFWLSETPDVPASKSWNTACTRVCSYLVLKDRRTGRRFCFANTHTDHKSAEAREKGMLLILARMKAFGEGCPIVFTGDHNCTDSEAPALAVSTILRNALYVSETPAKGGWRTWNGWRVRPCEVPATEALGLPIAVRNAKRHDACAEGRAFYERCGGPRIDYIYVSPGVRVLDYETVNERRPDRPQYPSDHFPVVATIRLP